MTTEAPDPHAAHAATGEQVPGDIRSLLGAYDHLSACIKRHDSMTGTGAGEDPTYGNLVRCHANAGRSLVQLAEGDAGAWDDAHESLDGAVDWLHVAAMGDGRRRWASRGDVARTRNHLAEATAERPAASHIP